MRKIIPLFIIVLLSSCADVTQMSYRSKYQRQNMTKFGRVRGYQKGSSNYVPASRRGAYSHPAVRPETSKQLKQANR